MDLPAMSVSELKDVFLAQIRRYCKKQALTVVRVCRINDTVALKFYTFHQAKLGGQAASAHAGMPAGF